MRIIVFGAGAVGSVIGGRLHQAGAEVVLVARQAHVDAIRADGLRLVTAEGVDTIHVPAVSNIAELEPRPDDFVIITAKTQDTPAIHDALLAWNPHVAVACGTNGVEHERMALRRFEQVYGMVIQLPAQYLTPGTVTAWCLPTNAIIDLGRYPNGVDEMASTFAALANAAPYLSCEADADIMAKKYEKILINLGNAAEAACGPYGRLSAPVKAAQVEAKLVYDAAGVRCYEDIASKADVEAYAARRASMQLRAVDGVAFSGGSTWQSLARGATSLETDYFNGEVVLLGRLHGFATPHNAFLQRLAASLVRVSSAPQTMTVEQVEERWRSETGGSPEE
jgi:2-dehydropantoate 2-reductase